MTRLLGLLLLLLPSIALAQTCQTYFVDGNTPTNNFAKAITDLNSGGCTTGLNKIIVDNSAGGFGDTVLANPLPTIARPVEIEMFSPATGRHVIRSLNATATSTGYGLRSTARVVINDIEIQGGGGRAFFGGIYLDGPGASNSRIQGVRVSNVRNQGIRSFNVDGLEIRRSANRPTEVVSSGYGINLDAPQWEPAILVSGGANITILGTFLGMEQDGTPASNCSYGIDLFDVVGATIGGNLSSINARNHIGFHDYGGIRARNSSLVNILGNYVGLAANGQTQAGNGFGTCFGGSPGLPRGGIILSGTVASVVGGSEGQGTVVVSNFRGIVLDNSHNISVRRSLIGQRPTGQAAVNQDVAIRVENDSGNAGLITIGGSTETFANVIRGAAGALVGVQVAAGSGRVDIRRNSIHGHTASGISRTSPDPAAPVVSLADPNTSQVAGTLTPVPQAGEVDLYADAGGQGRWYLGTIAVAANASNFSGTLSSPEFIQGRNLTATFTRLHAAGPGTSRFSTPVVIAGSDPIFADGFD